MDDGTYSRAEVFGDYYFSAFRLLWFEFNFKRWAMKRWLVILFALGMAGCCDNKVPTPQVIVSGVTIDKDTFKAMKFCEDMGKAFYKYRTYDFRLTGEGYEYQISCEDKRP